MPDSQHPHPHLHLAIPPESSSTTEPSSTPPFFTPASSESALFPDPPNDPFRDPHRPDDPTACATDAWNLGGGQEQGRASGKKPWTILTESEAHLAKLERRLGDVVAKRIEGERKARLAGSPAGNAGSGRGYDITSYLMEREGMIQRPNNLNKDLAENNDDGDDDDEGVDLPRSLGRLNKRVSFSRVLTDARGNPHDDDDTASDSSDGASDMGAARAAYRDATESDGLLPAAGAWRKEGRVRFSTRSKKYSITDAPILVPVSLRRFGLSEVINHLLGTSGCLIVLNYSPIPFDFIIDGKFLRTTLSTYLERENLSTENVIPIEYVESTLPPQPSTSFQHDDWVSDVAGPADRGSLIATASYDGNARIWVATGGCLAVLKRHEGSVKSVAWVLQGTNALILVGRMIGSRLTYARLRAENDGSSATLVSGGEDEKIYGWKYDPTSKKVEVVFEARAHKGSVDCLAVSSDASRFASASWDSTINVWSVAATEGEEEDADTPEVDARANGKRKRLNPRKVPAK
ncbi:WD repeat-containing protein 12, partial [Irineochytrium annulatum]